MTAAKGKLPSGSHQLDKLHDFASVRDAWMNLKIYDKELDGLMSPSTFSPSFPQIDHRNPLLPILSQSDSAPRRQRPKANMGVLRRKHNSKPQSDVAKLYYQSVSAIKWLYDDLINLGPRPDNYVDAAEYAQEHLQILKDLSARRQEVMEYRKLCLTQGIHLDEDPDELSDAQSEDIYQALLDELQSGPARIESLVAVQNGRQEDASANMDHHSAGNQSSGIAQWAASIELQSEQVVEDTYNHGD
jgi:hypothetical protein